jgi:hypothetical protein
VADTTGQRTDGVAIKMVVVIVRKDDRIDRRQLRHGKRWRRKALRPRKRHRRRTGAEHGIGEQAQSVDFNQHAGMAQPCHLQGLRRGAAQHIRAHRRHRQWILRFAAQAAMGTHRLPHLAQARNPGIGNVAKAAIAPCRRTAMRPCDATTLRYDVPSEQAKTKSSNKNKCNNHDGCSGKK